MVIFETDLIQAVVDTLQARLPPSWRVQLRREPRGRTRPDAFVNILSPDGTEGLLALETVTPSTARYLRFVLEISQRTASDLPGVPVMTVAPFLSPNIRRALKENGFSYADSTGNFHLAVEKPPIFIELSGADRDPNPIDSSLQSLKGSAAGRAIRALCDFRPPFGIRELALRTNVPAPTLSRVAELFEREGIVKREESRGPILEVDWQAAIRLWVRDYSFTRSNKTSAWLEPRGLPALKDKLRDSALEYALTGSLAASAVSPITASRLAAIFVDQPEAAARGLGLLPAESGSNVVLAQPYDPVAFERGFQEEGLKYAAYSQVAADLLTGPGRSPAEGDELLRWMEQNERSWRA